MPFQNQKTRIRVGVSSCLLGEKVRWDGNHKQDRTVKDRLGRLFEWVPTCPEVEIGMGIPRETVKLTGNPRAPRMVGNTTGTDWTQRMTRYANKRSRELAKLGVCGYIFKSRSPSCGVSRIPVTSNKGKTKSNGPGLFTEAFLHRCSLVPVEDEGRLHDARIRENFITRVFAYHRLAKLLAGRFSRKALVEFHTAHQFFLLAHSRKHYETLDRLIANPNRLAPSKLKTRYAEQFMQALAFKTTVKKNAVVLNHMLGYFKKLLSDTKKNEVIEAIEGYRNERVSLSKPITLIRRHAQKHHIDCLTNQVYLNPHPKELMLRNRV